jgi:hypothetical protein
LAARRVDILGNLLSELMEPVIANSSFTTRWFCKLGIEDAIPDHSAFLATASRGAAAITIVYRLYDER